jgi:hypothetical protein
MKKKYNNSTPLAFISIFQISGKNLQKRGHPGRVRVRKNGLKGLFEHVRLGKQ